MKTLSFYIPGIMCEQSCGSIIKNRINLLQEDPNNGIKDFLLDANEKKLTVYIDDECDTGAISKCIIDDLAIFDFVALPIIEPVKQFDWLSLIKGVIGIVCGIVILTLMLVFPHLAGVALFVMAGCSALVTLWIGFETYVDAFNRFLSWEASNRNTLFAISTLTVMVCSFIPGFHLMMEVALFTFGLMHIGKLLEDSIRNEISVATSLENRAVKTVTKLDDNQEIKNYPANVLIPGDKIRILGGETIPVDGRCMTDNAAINNAIVSGDHSKDVNVELHGDIHAGMVVPKYMSYVDIEVTKPVSESYLVLQQKKNDLARSDKAAKAEIEKTIDKMLHYFVPAVLAFAFVTGLAVLLFSGAALALSCVAFILVSACPCTLAVAPSLATKIGISKASQKGVHFKSSQELEKLNDVKAVVFDLNGTMTNGEPKVINHYVDNEVMSDNDFFSALMLIENKDKHVIAKAIRDYVKTHISDEINTNIEIPINRIHCGIEATIGIDTYLVGNEEFLIKKDVEIPLDIDLDAQQIIFLVKNKKIAGYLKVEDQLREHAVFVMAELKKRNIAVYQCTGADKKTAERYASQLGILPSNVRANVEPNSKAAFIKQLQEEKGLSVLGVVDGVNDTGMAIACDCSIAVLSKSGAVETQDLAGAVVEEGHLLPILAAFDVANETVTNIKRSVGFSLGYNMVSALLFLGLLIGCGFALNAAFGVALMFFSMMCVLAYQYTVSQQELPYVESLRQAQSVQDENDSTMGYLLSCFKCICNPSSGRNIEVSQNNNKLIASPMNGEAKYPEYDSNDNPTLSPNVKFI